MMRRIALFAALLLAPLFADGQSLQRPRSAPEVVLTSRFINGAITAITLGGTKLPADQGFRVSRVTFRTSSTVNVTGGTTVTLRVTDGTNNCDCAKACTGASGFSLTGQDAICTGTCSFAPGSSLTFSVTTAGCTTVQPSVLTVEVRGYAQ
jgi:hypothetical protein